MRLVDLLCENVTYTCIYVCSQKWMAVVSLEADQDSEKFSEPTALRKLARQNKYEIKAVAWCPHPARQSLLASAVSSSLSLSLSLFLPPIFFHSLRATPSIVCVHVCTSGLSNLNSANLPNLILAKVNSMIILMLVHVQMYIQCQQKVEIWDVKAERHPLLLSIKAHTRPVR